VEATVLFSHFGRVTGLLASYDLFLVSRQKTTDVSYIQFEWPEGDKVTTGGKSVVFWRHEFCFLTCVAVTNYLQKGVTEPQTEACNRFHMWGSDCYILGTALFSKVVTWLANADCMTTLASKNRPIGDELLSRKDVVNSDPRGWSQVAARYLPWGSWRLKLIEVRRDWAVWNNQPFILEL
jgi:hypothetical protein